MTSFTPIKSAEQYCEKNGYQFTTPRKQVLEILLSNTKALGAYDIIKKLSNNLKIIKPPTVYRAIDFWLEHGFIHKIESLNAYISCCHQGTHAYALMMICYQCHDIKEIAMKALPATINKILTDQKFKQKKSIIEISGECIQCS